MYIQPFETSIKKVKDLLVMDEPEYETITAKKFIYLQQKTTLGDLPPQVSRQNVFSFNSYITNISHSVTDFRSLINVRADNFELYILAALDKLIESANIFKLTKIHFQTLDERVLEGLLVRGFDKIRITSFVSNGSMGLKNYYTAQKLL